ncbi:MAG: methyltransferase domain-containing protein [Lachnospiraceae bacterium]|nr:methyltransferase domain-containing protein [Lachnospiraceae bacterium]
MENKIKSYSLKGLANAQDLAYFFSLQDTPHTDNPSRTAKKWDQRAELWKKKHKSTPKNDDRVISAITYLENKGLLQENFEIVDIGCGPGRFAAAFAKRVHRVVGLDISEKMVAHGMEYISDEGIKNAILRTCDFQSMDLEKEGYKGAFDLVFSSMTPAIHGIDGLTKSIQMSRGWCCNITHLGGYNLLREQIMQEVFGRKASPQWTGRWFYSLFNVLFLMGYYPETSYENRLQETLIAPDEEYVDFLMEQMLPTEEHSEANAKKIMEWLNAHVNEDGLIKEVTESSYGRILWDVRNKTERPDYRKMEFGI